MPHAKPDARMERCIQECHECATVCLETTRHCLELGGEHATARHIATLLDCADICETSAAFMARGSDLHGRICAACADVCERCAEECERFPDDEMMRGCAEICRRTAQSCREMAQVAA
jgi:hypothetical protein